MVPGILEFVFSLPQWADIFLQPNARRVQGFMPGGEKLIFS
jgi:hypothetical protein